MYTEIKDEEQLLAELQSKVEQEVTIHYECEECGDDQVTYEMEITPDIIEDLQADGYLMVSYECTNCGNTTKFLHADHIKGIED